MLAWILVMLVMLLVWGGAGFIAWPGFRSRREDADASARVGVHLNVALARFP